MPALPEHPYWMGVATWLDLSVFRRQTLDGGRIRRRWRLARPTKQSTPRGELDPAVNFREQKSLFRVQVRGVGVPLIRVKKPPSAVRGAWAWGTKTSSQPVET